MYLHGTSKINDKGHLEIGGCDTVELARTYGTPLYVFDEAHVRGRMREYTEAFRKTGIPFQVAYASKAFCVMAICRIADEEGLSLDVVSDGELYTALQAGFPASRIHFHGNNKTPDEMEMAVKADIGCFVVDNFVELDMLNAIAGHAGKKVNVLLRVTPGIDVHTHEFISTGQTDSKFGFDLDNGDAMKAVKQAIDAPSLELLGIHSHIGSQIFIVEGFYASVQKAAQFTADIRKKYDYALKVVNVGGGFGIRYTAEDEPLPVSDYVDAIAKAMKTSFAELSLDIPEIWVEPGRSIVGEAGTTLYTIGTHKNIPGVRKYISVDGGMSDNPRYALYGAKYEAMIANRAKDPDEEVVTVAGKACESGDKLIVDLSLPKSETGDVLAVSCTGAYNYSMASNYNRIRRPAVVFVAGGKADLVVDRETHTDIVGKDRVPERLLPKVGVPLK